VSIHSRYYTHSPAPRGRASYFVQLQHYICYVLALWYERQNRGRRELVQKTIDVLVSIAMLMLDRVPVCSQRAAAAGTKPLHFDSTSFIGYRTRMSFPVERHVTVNLGRCLSLWEAQSG